MDTNAQWQSTVITLAAIINVLITACYALFAYLLWKSTNESVRLTRHMLEASYSPYVGVQSVEIPMIVGDSVSFLILLKNYGNSPAQNLSTNIEFLLDGNVVQDEQIGPSSLPPQAEAHIQTHCSAERYGMGGTRQIVLDFTYDGIAERQYHRRERYEHRYAGGLIPLPCNEVVNNPTPPTQE